MSKDSTCCVAIVDPSKEFVFFEDLLQLLLPCPIVGFDDPELFYQTIQKPNILSSSQYLTVIADRAAISPTIEDGVFSKARSMVSNFCGIAFTANPSRPEWDVLIKKGVIKDKKHVIDRGNPSSPTILMQVLKDIIGECNKSKGSSISNESDEIVPPHLVDLVQTENGVGVEDLIEPRLYIARLLKKNTLGFWGRFIIHDTAWYAFRKMKEKKPEHFNKYLQFIRSKNFPKEKPGWRIISEVLDNVEKVVENKS
jgi:hypothetical protein